MAGGREGMAKTRPRTLSAGERCLQPPGQAPTGPGQRRQRHQPTALRGDNSRGTGGMGPWRQDSRWTERLCEEISQAKRVKGPQGPAQAGGRCQGARQGQLAKEAFLGNEPWPQALVTAWTATSAAGGTSRSSTGSESDHCTMERPRRLSGRHALAVMQQAGIEGGA